MGSTIIPIVANLYMEYFEGKALKSAANPPGYGIGLWMTPRSFKNNLVNKNPWNT